MAVYLYDRVVVPLRQMCKAYRWGGIMAIASLCLAFLGILSAGGPELGMVLLIISLALWKLTVYQFRRKRR